MAEQTRAQRSLWVDTLKAEVRGTLPFLSETAARLVVAHLALESGFGTSRAAMRGLNLGNLTAGSAWQGGRWTDEGGDVNGAGVKITQVWRTYGSIPAFLADYWTFLGPAANTGRYVLARNALERSNLDDFCRLLYSAGYYELAPTEYAKRLHAAYDAVSVLLEPPRIPPVVP